MRNHLDWLAPSGRSRSTVASPAPILDRGSFGGHRNGRPHAASMDAMLLWLKGTPRSFRKPRIAISADTAHRLIWPPLGRLRLRAFASATASGSSRTGSFGLRTCRLRRVSAFERPPDWRRGQPSRIERWPPGLGGRGRQSGCLRERKSALTRR